MTKRNFILGTVVIFLFIISIANTLAITASMGNSRMILRASPGETIEKYILVKNINDVPLTINITVSGDLAEKVSLREDSFSLQPQQEKKAYFTIKAQNEINTTETQINVRYSPPTGPGVGLAAKVIIITSGEAVNDTEDDSDSPDVSEEENNTIGGVNVNVGGNNEKTLTAAQLLLISTTILIVLLLIVIIVYYLKNKGSPRKIERKQSNTKLDNDKKSVGRAREK